MLKQLNEDNFHEEVRDSQDTVVVLFTVDGNTVCENYKPVVEEMAQAMSGDIMFAEIDLDNADFIADEFKINNAPALVLFSEGMLRDVLFDLHKKNEIRMWIADNI